MLRRALAVLGFPRPPRTLDWYDRRELAATLAELGRRIAAGATIGGTVIVPAPRRITMKIAFRLSGPDGPMHDLDSQYHRLPPDIAAEIVAACQAFAAMISGTQGKAGAGDPAYTVTLSWSGEGPKGQAKAERLLYSQALAIQDAGVDGLKALNVPAWAEVKAGRRK